MVAVILVGFLFVFVCVVISMVAMSDFETGPEGKLKKRNKVLEKENEILLLATKDWQRENDQLRAENFALRENLPYPTIAAHEKEREEILNNIIDMLNEEKVNGS